MRLAVATVLAALPWLTPFRAEPSPHVQPWLVSVACGIGLWLLARTVPPHHRLPRALLVACVALVGWAVLSYPGLGPEMVMLAGALALVVLVATAASHPLAAPAMQAGLLAAATLSAILGLAQYFGVASAFEPWITPARQGVAFANLRQTNQYATLCWMGVAVVLWGRVPLSRFAKAAIVVLLAIGCAASASRTGLLAGLTLLVLALAWRDARGEGRLALCGVALVAYAAASWALPALLQEVTGAPGRVLWARLGAEYGCASRRVLWSNVLTLIGQKPWVGWGWGELDYAHYITAYPGPRFCEIADNAHNLPLHLAAELGVPAALAICAGCAWWAWRQAPWRETKPLRQLAWALLALLLVHSLLEYPLWYGPFQLAAGAALGWLLAMPTTAAPVPRLASRAAVAALLLALVAYAGWDHARVSQIYLPPEERRAGWQDDTLAHVRASWLFSGPARFADLTLAAPDRSNAAWMYALSQQVLHYSPEPRVIERLIESATLLGRDEEALAHLVRYRAAFPDEYAEWQRRHRLPASRRLREQGVAVGAAPACVSPQRRPGSFPTCPRAFP